MRLDGRRELLPKLVVLPNDHSNNVMHNAPTMILYFADASKVRRIRICKVIQLLYMYIQLLGHID